MESPVIAVYGLRHIRTGRVYVGASADLRRRMATHYSALKGGKHPCQQLQADWREDGPSGFELETLEVLQDAGGLRERETHWIGRSAGQGAVYNVARSSTYTREHIHGRPGLVPNPLPPFVTPREAAALLRVHHGTVRGWIKEGRLPAFRIGGRLRIKPGDLDRLVSTSTAATTAGNTEAA